jgi:excisionase family DNA binding protein
MLVFPTSDLAKTMPSSAADNAIMTIGEVADYLKVTERTIYRLAGAKQIPAFKVGGSWRFSKAEIDQWIKKQSMEMVDTGNEFFDQATGRK